MKAQGKGVLKALGVAAALGVAGWMALHERASNPELAKWQGRDWRVECTEPDGRAWTLRSFLYLDGSTSPPRERFTDRGVEVQPPGAAKVYKTTLFRHRALERDGVWRWRTTERGSGWTKAGYRGLPEGTEEVEVSKALDEVRWTTRGGEAGSWPCTPVAGEGG